MLAKNKVVNLNVALPTNAVLSVSLMKLRKRIEIEETKKVSSDIFYVTILIICVFLDEFKLVFMHCSVV